MTRKKYILISSIVIIAISIIFISLYISKPMNTIPPTSNIQIKSEITISTDKDEYNNGDTIKIVVKNGLDKSIFYSSGGDRFWGIEYFMDNEWINPVYEESGGFQLTEENLGNDCYIALYERMPLSELESQSVISSQWNQKICPFGTGSPVEPRTVKYIESGKYRLIFNYGFEISDDDLFKLSDIKTACSNAFTIN